METNGLRLSVYLGERDRVGRRLLADELIDVLARHGVRTSVLLRGIEGFGIKHRLQSERLLSLSEDLPLLAIAVDSAARIEAALADVRAISPHGVITLERARLLGSTAGHGLVGEEAKRAAAAGPGGMGEEAKLTIYIGRQDRVGGRPAHVAAVECLRSHGVAGASVLLGLDGTVAGVRRRARFFAHNGQVPLMIQSVGARARIASALGELAGMLRDPAITLERVRVCKRDGRTLADLPQPPPADALDLAYWQKLVVYTGGQDRHQRESVHAALVRRLRREGAAGATALRSEWGYHGEHRPHGERLWSVSRHAGALTVLLDTPANMARWFAVVDEMTERTGLVTAELVPALRTAAPEHVHGGLELAPAHRTVRR